MSGLLKFAFWRQSNFGSLSTQFIFDLTTSLLQGQLHPVRPVVKGVLLGIVVIELLQVITSQVFSLLPDQRQQSTAGLAPDKIYTSINSYNILHVTSV